MNSPSLPGFEPGIFWSVVRRVIHCATDPFISFMKLISNQLIIVMELWTISIDVQSQAGKHN